ncbi:MAG TPA: hypothetical protein GXX41_02010 [Thermoanaerobacterium sp.]|nr:hypothetical protein [Thermoanaerobacterium sp.]
MQIQCTIDTEAFNSKPKGNQIPKIVNRMNIKNARYYSIYEIMNLIIQGHTIKPAVCGLKEQEWQSQQLFLLDVDNDKEYISSIDMINRLKEQDLIPAFIYSSFSSTPDHEKYRIAYILDKAIEDIEIAKKIQLYLIKIVGDNIVDNKCKNLNRIYFGGKDIVFKSDNVLSLDDMIKKIDDFYDKKVAQSVDTSGIEGNEVKSTYNNNNINNTTLLYVPFTQNPKTLAITAIEAHQSAYFLQKYNPEKKIFETKQQFIDYILHINLPELLEIENYKSFNCIFHEDKNPSAGIFQNENGDWIYNCFGCGVSYNIIGVIERLLKSKTRPETYDFIKEMLNIEIKETEFQKKQKEVLINTLQSLYSDEFIKYCPTTNKNIRTIREYLQQLILIALDNVYDEEFTDNEGNVVFFTSMRELAKRLGISQYNINKISQRLVVLVYHELLKKLDDKEIPERFLEKANKIMNDNNLDNKISFYSIPSLTFNKYPEIEEQGNKWKDNHYTIKGTSYEMFYRAEGKEVADRLYPQMKTIVDKETGEIKERTTSKTSDKRVKDIVKVIKKLIDKKGYATEDEIIKILSKKYNKTLTETQIKKTLPAILKDNDFKRVKANKQLKEQFKIKSKGYPYIITK